MHLPEWDADPAVCALAGAAAAAGWSDRGLGAPAAVPGVRWAGEGGGECEVGSAERHTVKSEQGW